ncbi:hypothetical protein [Blastococcus sp. SYSU D00695]
MILAAGLLVLAGLGLFVAGLATGTTAFSWACTACCGVAAVLLVVVRLRPGAWDAPAAAPVRPTDAGDRVPAAATSAEAAPAAAAGAPAETDAGAGAGTAAPTGRHSAPEASPAGDAAPGTAAPAAGPAGVAGSGGDDPAEEDVEFSDLLLVVDMRDEVLVVDEHPRYHLADCRWLRGRATVPLPVAEARVDGFTPCAVCRPDGHLADVARARRSAARD